MLEKGIEKAQDYEFTEVEGDEKEQKAGGILTEMRRPGRQGQRSTRQSAAQS